MSDKLQIIFKSNNQTDVLSLTPEECLNLELKLNVTEYARKWVKIGDNLYDFAIRLNKLEPIIYVTEFQFMYLKNLHLENKR